MQWISCRDQLPPKSGEFLYCEQYLSIPVFLLMKFAETSCAYIEDDGYKPAVRTGKAMKIQNGYWCEITFPGQEDEEE